MKEPESISDLVSRVIPIEGGDGPWEQKGCLIPIGLHHASDAASLQALAEWRTNGECAYPTRFRISIDGTRNWLLSSVLDNERRILFFIADFLLRPIGHIGLVVREDGVIELDNVLRGLPDLPGLMSDAVKALETWIREQLDVAWVELRVLASNEHAIAFYEELGYVELARQPLRWETSKSGRALVPSDGGSDDEFVTMGRDLEEHREAENFIATAGPVVGHRETSYVASAARSGWGSHSSDYLREFESAFAEAVGTRFAMTTSSCTGALHLALLACGLGPGDEVLVPETTWVATGAAIAYTGATPVFVDVDRVSWTMDADKLEQALTPRTRAVMPVHLYGFPAPMTQICAFAAKHSLRIVEDAAPAVGATVGGKPVGGIGDVGCFSFQGAKLLVAGEGGMLVTNDESLYLRAQKLNDHGRRPGTFVIEELGFKYKMNNMTAAFGLGQLQTVDAQVAKKLRIHQYYRELLDGVPGLSFQEALPNSTSAYWMTSILIDENSLRTASELSRYLLDHNVDTRPVFPPQSSFEIWGEPDLDSPAHPVATELGGQALNLPSGANLSRASIRRVSQLIRDFLEE